MATEHVIDLEHQRYADREYAGPLPASRSSEEARQERSRQLALGRMKARVAQEDDMSELVLDFLILLGLNE